MIRTLSYVLALLLFGGMSGCLYIPPLSNATGKGTVAGLKAEGETRASLREKLGLPNVVDLPVIQVWEWQQNLGTVIGGSPMGGGGFDMKGAHFRVLARLDGDRVVALETEFEPPREPPACPVDLPEPSERIRLEPSARDLSDYRIWVDPGGRLYAVGCGGDLWIRDPGRSSIVKVAELGGAVEKGARNDTQGAFSPEARLLALSRGSRVVLWDTVEGRVVDQLPAFDGPARQEKHMHGSAAFSPDGKYLAIAGLAWSFWNEEAHTSLRLLERSSLKAVWRTEGTQPRESLGDPRPQFSPDGTRLLGTGALFDARSGRRLAALPPGRAAFLAKGDRLAVLGRDLELRDAGTGRILGRAALGAGPDSAVKEGWRTLAPQVLPDGMLSALGRGVWVRCDPGALEGVLDSARSSGREAPALEGGTFLQVRLLPLRSRTLPSSVQSFWDDLPPRWERILSPTGELLLEKTVVLMKGGSHPGQWSTRIFRILDARSLKTLWEVWPPRDVLGEVQFLDDGALLQVVGGEVRIWSRSRLGL